MLFKTKKDNTFLFILLFVFFLYTGISIYSIFYENDHSVIWFFIGVLLFLALLFFLIVKTTYFILDKDKLICKSLFFTKEIPYEKIRKIEKQTGIYAGWKYSTAWKGLIVYYNKYDDILISPENEEIFIQEISPKINVQV